MASGLKYPPEGVETAPTSTDVVSAAEAARILKCDYRTVVVRIKNGTLPGGAEPRPKHLGWYVYRRTLLPNSTTPAAASRADMPADLSAPDAALEAVVASQAARIMTLEHNNRVLAAAADELREGLDGYKTGAHEAMQAANHAMQAANQFQWSSEKYASAVARYRDALGQYMTPSNLETVDTTPPPD